jgi:hypothetical protein
MSPDVRVTTPLIWTCTGILFILDAVLILLARRFISREGLIQMRWKLPIAAGSFFFLLWISVLIWGWDWFYRYIFSDQRRYLLPPLFGVGYTLLAICMVWLSLKLPGRPAVTWCVLGGVEGLFSHIYAIYGLGAVSKPPIMQGSDSFSVLIFAVFEKTFYWSLILLVTWSIWRLTIRRRVRFHTIDIDTQQIT